MKRRRVTACDVGRSNADGAGLRVWAIVLSGIGLVVLFMSVATARARSRRDSDAEAAARAEIVARDELVAATLAAVRAENEERIRAINSRLDATIGDPDESKANDRLLEELGRRMQLAGLADPKRLRNLRERHGRASDRHFIEETERRAASAGDLETACAIYEEALNWFEYPPCAALYNPDRHDRWCRRRDRLATDADRWIQSFFEDRGRVHEGRRDPLALSERASWFAFQSTIAIEVDWFDRGLRLQTGELGRPTRRPSTFAFDGWSDQVYDLSFEIEFKVLRGALAISLRYRPDGATPLNLGADHEARFTAGVEKRLSGKLIGLRLCISEDGGPESIRTVDPSYSRYGGIGFSLDPRTTVLVKACEITVLRRKPRS